ncbi:unnamed protein product, partial [Wuchereria bancrofti]
GDSIFTPAKVEGKKKAVKCIGSTKFEQFRTTGHGCNALFTNSGNSAEEFCDKTTDAVFSGVLKDERHNESSKNVFRSSDTKHSSCSECCKVIQSSPSKTEQHAFISTIKAEGQVNKLVESMVMANGDSETRSSSNKTSDRTCIDVERILHNESYRKPFQVKYYHKS